MGKLRRPRGPRSTWEPKSPPIADRPAAIEAPLITETSTALPPEIAPEVPSQALERALTQAAEGTGTAGPDHEEAAAPPRNAAPDAPEIAPNVPAESPAQPPVQLPAVQLPAVLPAILPAAPVTAGAVPERGIVLAPDRFDVVEIGTTVARYMRGEGEAAMAHLRALSVARSPAEIIRLQVGEAQRAADASLTCWVTVIGKASRAVAFR